VGGWVLRRVGGKRGEMSLLSGGMLDERCWVLIVMFVSKAFDGRRV
jgi:hypothetical protein